jgi:hypothetical protein
MADVVLYVGNTSPSVVDTILVNGSAIDLTGSTIRFQARDPRSNTLVINAGGGQITILNQTTNKGGVQYDPASGDVATSYEVPPLVGWWDVTLPSGRVQDTPETFNVYIRAHGQARSGDLCTVTDVRKHLRIIADHTRDDEIQAKISRASPMINRWCGREFAPSSTGVTRTFPIDVSGGDLVVELDPYDLRAATTVTLSPEGAATVLTSSQYSLEPVNAPDGVYKRIRISPFVGGVISTWALTFGYAKMSITGNWGFATVPDDVVQAAAVIIASWIDVAQGQYQSSDVFADLPRLTLPNPDARSAWAILGAYKRMVP